MALQLNHDEIARRAYELYQQRGGSDGRDWEAWLQAERELRRPDAPHDSVQALIASGAAVAV